ncbi:MAG: phosphoribosylamine--glycine ligase [Bacillota bacterium]|nr:phosphoribosylamine--glycine ligase [Bacillota bacterium]
MKILVVGGGGREHAIIWKLKQGKRTAKVFCAPGNGGIASLATCIDYKATDIENIIKFAKNEGIDLTIVAQDDPLALGMVDALEKEGLRAFGPNKAAAQIEASKSFAKGLMKKNAIPTAAYEVFDDAKAAKAYLAGCTFPIVVKADGLALGKGVFICDNAAEAVKAVENIMVAKAFGKAGDRIIVEEFLSGHEVSVLVFTDGKTVLPMESSQDHKRVFDFDQGPNTGGMGAFSPSPYYTAEVEKETIDKIIMPTVRAMALEDCLFKGVLYFGLMLTKKGVKVLEYNARFGDPETQVILPRLKNELLDVMDAVIDGRLDQIQLEWDSRAAVCVIMASAGYPGQYQKGFEVMGLDTIAMLEDVMVFHAGTQREGEQIFTSGGRVLGVTALGDTLRLAADKAYTAVQRLSFEGAYFRKDIAMER